MQIAILQGLQVATVLFCAPLLIMLAHQIKRLVVVDEAGKPLGLVDRQQLLHSLVEGGGKIRPDWPRQIDVHPSLG